MASPSTPQDLAAHPAVGFRNPATGQLLTWRFAAPRGGVVRFAPKPRHIVDDAHAALSLVREGFGVAWGPSWLVGPLIREGRVVEVLTPWRMPEEPLWMVRTSNRRPPERTLKTMAFLASLPPDGA